MHIKIKNMNQNQMRSILNAIFHAHLSFPASFGSVVPERAHTLQKPAGVSHLQTDYQINH